MNKDIMVNIKLEKYYSDYIIFDDDEKDNDGQIDPDYIFIIKKDQIHSLYNQMHSILAIPAIPTPKDTLTNKGDVAAVVAVQGQPATKAPEL